MELIKNVKHGEEFSLRNLVQLEPGRVNSLTLSQTPGCKITVFAIAAGEGMSSHAAAGDAMVTCLEGKAQIVIDDIVHEVSPGITLRTTLIAGFPGETDIDFDVLQNFLEEVEFDYVGVFPYSQEEGTRAAEMDGQIDEAVKIERAQSLRDISDAIGEAHVSARIGQEMDVLVLGREEDGQLYGRAMCQAPEVDGVVYLEEGEVGDIVRVRITDTLVYEMEGDVVHGS